MKIVITAQLETSNHDGYCSGEECEYETKMVNEIIDLPERHKDIPLHGIPHSDLISLLPEPHVQNYIILSPEVRDHCLDVHDYRYTIIAVNYFNPDVESHDPCAPTVKRRKVSNNYSNYK
jgi:hypothetical protein